MGFRSKEIREDSTAVVHVRHNKECWRGNGEEERDLKKTARVESIRCGLQGNRANVTVKFSAWMKKEVLLTVKAK